MATWIVWKWRYAAVGRDGPLPAAIEVVGEVEAGDLTEAERKARVLYGDNPLHRVQSRASYELSREEARMVAHRQPPPFQGRRTKETGNGKDEK